MTFDDYADLPEDGAHPRCEVIWNALSTGLAGYTPEGRVALDRRLAAFMPTIKDKDLRAHYGAFFDRKRAEMFAR